MVENCRDQSEKCMEHMIVNFQVVIEEIYIRTQNTTLGVMRVPINKI